MYLALAAAASPRSPPAARFKLTPLRPPFAARSAPFSPCCPQRMRCHSRCDSTCRFTMAASGAAGSASAAGSPRARSDASLRQCIWRSPPRLRRGPLRRLASSSLRYARPSLLAPLRSRLAARNACDVILAVTVPAASPWLRVAPPDRRVPQDHLALDQTPRCGNVSGARRRGFAAVPSGGSLQAHSATPALRCSLRSVLALLPATHAMSFSL